MSQEFTTEQLIARGKDAYSRNAYLVALGDFSEVVRREPRFADIHNLSGLCLSLIGRPGEAVEAFERALELNPDYVEAQLNRAITLNELGRLDEASQAFLLAAEADVDEVGGRFSATVAGRLANKHAELGDLYAEADGLREAEEQYRRACEIRPRFLDLRNKLARTLLDLGRPSDAIRELRSILKANPSFLIARMNLGLALYKEGHALAAEEEWTRCLAQQPENAQVTGYLGMLRRQKDASPGD